MSVGASGSKNTDHSQSNTNQLQQGSQTPNNLPWLTNAWRLGAQSLPSMPTIKTLSHGGATSTIGAVPQATTTASAGAGAATDFANGNFVANPADPNLTPYATGAYVNSQNPSFQELLRQISQGAQASTDGSFAADGRYGSGANANAFNSAVVNEAGQLGYQNYGDQQQRQLAANQQLASDYATGRGQQLEGAGLAPATTSNLFTPGTQQTTAAYAPLMAYLTMLTTGNPGGSFSQTGNVNTTGNDLKTSLSAQASAGAGGGGGGPSFGGL